MSNTLNESVNICWLIGIVGFLGFEGLRIYKAVLKSRPAVPQKRYGVYILALLLLAVFSAFAAHVMAGGNKLTALFVGFSVPTGMKTLFEDQTARNEGARNGVKVEDMKIVTVSPIRGAWLWVKAYFY